MVFETPVYFNFILICNIGDEEFYIFELWDRGSIVIPFVIFRVRRYVMMKLLVD